MKCKTCIFFTEPLGSEGRWMICTSPNMKVADAYEDYSTVPEDGIGYSQQTNNGWEGELYVGPEFGCVHHNFKFIPEGEGQANIVTINPSIH